MKVLYFVRHGKGVPRSEEPDVQRPLSDIGNEEADIMAERLRQEGISPELILCSPAERAQQTARIFANALDYDVQRIIIQEELYQGDYAQLLRIIQHLDDAYTSVMLIGHNPVLSEAAHMLAQNFDSVMRTSGVLGVNFTSADWHAICRNDAHLFLYDFPVRLAPKVQKSTEKIIRKELVATLGTLLDPIDHKLPGSLRKTVEKTSHRLAKDVLHVLHTSRLDSLLDQKIPPLEDETQT
jgi:phosphohistidine phosphatase